MTQLIDFIHSTTIDQGIEKGRRSYFTKNNPSVNVGIPLGASLESIVDNKASFVIDNTSNYTSGTPHFIVVDYIKFVFNAYQVTGLSGDPRVFLYVDNINRYLSGGTELIGKGIPDTYQGFIEPESKAKIYFGDLTLKPSSKEKEVDFHHIKQNANTGIPFTLSEDDTFLFGPFLSQHNEPAISDEPHKSSRQYTTPYVVINPGTSFIMRFIFSNHTNSEMDFLAQANFLEKSLEYLLKFIMIKVENNVQIVKDM